MADSITQTDPLKAIADSAAALLALLNNYPAEAGLSATVQAVNAFYTGINYLNQSLLNTPLVSITVLPHGILETITRSGVAIKKTFWTNLSTYKTDVNGLCSCNLTVDNTTNGAAIFTEIWYAQSRGMGTITSPNDIVLGMPNGPATNIKLTTHIFTRGASQTLGATLLSIANTLIVGMRIPVTGTPVQFKIEGV